MRISKSKGSLEATAVANRGGTPCILGLEGKAFTKASNAIVVSGGTTDFTDGNGLNAVCSVRGLDGGELMESLRLLKTFGRNFEVCSNTPGDVIGVNGGIDMMELMMKGRRYYVIKSR